MGILVGTLTAGWVRYRSSSYHHFENLQRWKQPSLNNHLRCCVSKGMLSDNKSVTFPLVIN